MSEVLFIYNPKAGRGRAKRIWPQVEQRLSGLNIEYVVQETQAAGHAMRIAAEAASQFRAVVAVGGDGTANEVANGLLLASGEQRTIPFGIIPLGNGDDFVKMIPPVTAIGKQPYTWELALEKVIRGQTASFDACRVRGVSQSGALVQTRYFINGLNLGFSAHAGYNFSTLPPIFTGFAGYLAAVLKTLWKYPMLHLELRVDDAPAYTCETSLIACMNGRCFGRAFWVAPQSDAQDGLLEIMRVGKIGRAAILRKLPLLLNGKHLNDPVVHWQRAAKVQISSATPMIVEMDGEIPFQGVERVDLEILPKVLTVLA